MKQKILGIPPHFSLILSLMLLTFFITDRFNTAMAFINHPMTKNLITVLAVLDLIVAIRLAFLNGKRTYTLRLIFSLILILSAIATVTLLSFDSIYPTRLLFTKDSVKFGLLALAILSAAGSVLLIACQRSEAAAALIDIQQAEPAIEETNV